MVKQNTHGTGRVTLGCVAFRTGVQTPVLQVTSSSVMLL